MQKFSNKLVEEKFDSYPHKIKNKLFELREMIFEVAHKEKSIENIEESLKWNEPSYITKNGSTLRIDWKKSKPDQYSMYFNCKTKLIPTFRELFRDKLIFNGNREIIFKENDILYKKIIKYCILLTLTYHDRKHLNMLDK